MVLIQGPGDEVSSSSPNLSAPGTSLVEDHFFMEVEARGSGSNVSDKEKYKTIYEIKLGSFAPSSASCCAALPYKSRTLSIRDQG